MNPYLEHFPPIAPAIREKDFDGDFDVAMVVETVDNLKQIVIPEEFKEFVRNVQTDLQLNGFLWERVYLEFPNGYGASVINLKYDSGTIELAVFCRGRLCHSTPITDDVIRLYNFKTWYDEESFSSLLNRIKLLKGENK